MTNKDFHTYIFDELSISYDSQALYTNRPGDYLLLTPGKRLIVELNGVKLVAQKAVKNTSIGLDRKQDMKQAILNAQQSVKKLS